VKQATTKLGDMTNVSERKALDAVAEQVKWIAKTCVISGKEAIFIQRSDLRWEENHTVAFDGPKNHNAGWTNSGNGKYIGVHRMEGMPGCGMPDPRGYLDHAKFNLSKHNGAWDSTFIVTRVGEYCESIGYGWYGDVGQTPRAGCPVRPEGSDFRVCWERHPEVIGEQQWWCNDIKLEECGATRNPNCILRNPAQATCRGHVKTCTQDGSTCAEAEW
jgi:hypothetical protein